jgi:hypothetical protein
MSKTTEEEAVKALFSQGDRTPYYETSMSHLIYSLERNFHKGIVKQYSIAEIILAKENKVIIKWVKRYKPLTDKEYKEKY